MKRLGILFSLLLGLVALPLLIASIVGAYFARLMVRPPRTQSSRSPDDEGMPYENVYYRASDGVPLSAWFIPASGQGPRPAVIIVHGWPWNRSGDAADSLLSRLIGTPPVDLFKPARALHQAGYHVLMFDLRNHGRSGSSPTVTFGHTEAYDLLGSVRYLCSRPDTDAHRIGALGYSMGANTVMFACAKTQDIQAAVAVQPVRPAPFGRRLAEDLLGPLGSVALGIAHWLYYRSSGPLVESLDPAIVADLISPSAIMYVQGNGDPWGDVADVRHFYEQAAAPKALKVVDTTDRYQGYGYLGEHPEVMLSFFAEHLTG